MGIFVVDLNASSPLPPLGARLTRDVPARWLTREVAPRIAKQRTIPLLTCTEQGGPGR